ncbi:uncharacterized protein LKV04_001776 [Tautogolabrus adspersus]
MAENIASFQSQLSGVMETVFKAAMYEITRLVEDSFLEEVTRCRDQVESLKRRLKWSESRRKEREGEMRARCTDCGRVGGSLEEEPRAPEKCLKQESVLQEETNGSTGNDGEMPCHESEEGHDAMKTKQSPDEKLDRLLKEETLQISPETNESQEKWGVNVEEASGQPGPSKRFSDQKIPKCHENWDAGFDQRPESGQGGHSGDPCESVFQSRYGMEDLGGFDKTGYGDTDMIDMGNLDGLHGSPSHLGDDMSYIGNYEGCVEAPEAAENQVYQAGAPRNRRGLVGPSAVSPSRTNNEVSGEFSCLLINEEGYLQDPSILYPEQVSGDPGGRLSLRGHGISVNPSIDSTEDMYGPSDGYNETFILAERLQHQQGGRRGRRLTCNQCSMSFPDSSSLKTHKQSHKSTAQVPPYSCTQCGKTFTQACNLKVHQRIHSGQGLHLCSHCGKGFPSFSDLKTHKCGQTGEKPYCCNVCGNKFSRLWNLKLHRRIHTQEKPHRCTMCDKSFTRADILKVHQRTHTGERPYCCAVCGLSFKRLDHLKSHQRKHMTDLTVIMSELDTLIATFQTQLSDVMETVVKTTMFEVTRLVEDGFLEEVKRRNQEVESLRLQLQWFERKVRHGEKEVSKNGQCANDGVELSCETAEEQRDVISIGCGVKKEAESVERWNRSHRQEVIPVAPLAAENLLVSQIIESQTTEVDDVLPVVDVKEEDVNKPSCSSGDLGRWSGAIEGKVVPESNNFSETTEAPQRQTSEKSEDLLRNAIKNDLQVSTEEQEETGIAIDSPEVVDSGWTGLTVTTAELMQKQIHAADKDCNPANSTGASTEVEHELPDSVAADVNVLIATGGDQILSLASPKAGLQNSDVLGVTIKQEVTVGFDECVESELKEKTVASFSSHINQHRASPVAAKYNRISHKARVQEIMKLHSKVGTGLRLQTAIQQLNRPMKKAHHALSNSTTAAPSVAHSQVVNFKSINRMPSTSKAAPPASHSVQQVHLGDKQAVAQNRSAASWVGIKSQHQSSNAHYNNALPHPDSHPVVGSRQLQRCGQCGKCFPHPSNLKAHLQTHTGERPFCCSLCGRSFTKLSNLKAHRRVHTGERPYCCLACGKRFTQKCNLKRHQRIHLDV